MEPYTAPCVVASPLVELVEFGAAVECEAPAAPLSSGSYMLRAFQSRSISHASLALIAFISAAEGSSEVGRALIEGFRSKGRAVGTSSFDVGWA